MIALSESHYSIVKSQLYPHIFKPLLLRRSLVDPRRNMGLLVCYRRCQPQKNQNESQIHTHQRL